MRFPFFALGLIVSFAIEMWLRNQSISKLVALSSLMILALIFLVVTLIRKGVPGGLDRYGLPDVSTDDIEEEWGRRKPALQLLEKAGFAALGVLFGSLIVSGVITKGVLS